MTFAEKHTVKHLAPFWNTARAPAFTKVHLETVETIHLPVERAENKLRPMENTSSF